jgi:NAD(P)H-dependent flavin oxidoreductase YrpB (nitropropane dioxygenase family)
MFQTRVTQMLGIQYPIVEGGMIWLGVAELAAAVSNAGGLGMITSGNFPEPEKLRIEIQKLRGLTDKPFGVNVSVMPTFRPVDRGSLIDTAIEEGAIIIETAGRDALQFGERIKKGQTKWIHKCARVRDAITAERSGADIVTIVGYECGGAPPTDGITTFIQVPLVVDAIKIPVLAGGGIGDARGFVAALALGAEGVVMGTRFTATRECMAHPNIKEAIIKAREMDTILVQGSIGTMQRVLRNKTAETVLAMEKRGASLEELKEFIAGERARKSWLEGDVNLGVLPCGQIIGLIREIVSVQELIYNMVEGAMSIHERLSPHRSGRGKG